MLTGWKSKVEERLERLHGRHFFLRGTWSAFCIFSVYCSFTLVPIIGTPGADIDNRARALLSTVPIIDPFQLRAMECNYSILTSGGKKGRVWRQNVLLSMEKCMLLIGGYANVL